MPVTPTKGKVITIKDVAVYMKITDGTIYRLAGARKIPAFRVGGTWRLSRADIDKWIRRQSSDSLTIQKAASNPAANPEVR